MLSIIMPAYNEEKRIGNTLLSYANYFKNAEFIVVCDGCTDKTEEIVEKIAKNHKNIRLLHFSEKLGKGGGVYAGFMEAKGDCIGFTDADNSVNVEEFKRLLNEMKINDCVIGSRRLPESQINFSVPLVRRSFSGLFNKIVNILFGLGIKDTQCGAKIFKRSCYEKIKNNLVCRGFEFDVELLWKIKKNGFGIKEVPITWNHDVDNSKSRVRNSVKMFYSLLKMRLNNG